MCLDREFQSIVLGTTEPFYTADLHNIVGTAISRTIGSP